MATSRSYLDDIAKKRRELANQKAQQETKKKESEQYSSGKSIREVLDQIAKSRRTLANEPNNTRSALAAIHSINEVDSKRANSLYSSLLNQRSNKTSKFYDPYSEATHSSVKKLKELGYDTSNIDDKWYEKNSWYKDYLTLSDYTNKPKTPGKRATREEKAAYEIYQLKKAEENTKKAESEQAELEKYLTGLAKDRKRTQSDREIIDSIDWEKYPTLAKMREYAGNGAPYSLTRSVQGSSEDWAYATLWRAMNNGGTGDYLTDLANSALGNGNTWETQQAHKKQMQKQVQAERDAYSEADMLRAEQRYQRLLPAEKNKQRYSLDDDVQRAEQREMRRWNELTRGALEENINGGDVKQQRAEQQYRRLLDSLTTGHATQDEYRKQNSYIPGRKNDVYYTDPAEDLARREGELNDQLGGIDAMIQREEEERLRRLNWQQDYSGVDRLYNFIADWNENNEKKILDRNSTDEEKARAQETLSTLQSNREDERERAINRVAGLLATNPELLTGEQTEEDRAQLRKLVFNELMGDQGAYDHYYDAFNADEIFWLDTYIDEALDLVTTPDAYRDDQLSAWQEKKQGVEGQLSEVTRQRTALNTAEEMAAQATGTGEYNRDVVEGRVKPQTGENALYINRGDDIDVAVYNANNPWLDEIQKMYVENGHPRDAEPDWDEVRPEYFMNDAQVRVLNQLYGDGTPEEKENARAYLEALKTYCLNQLKVQYQEERMRENARDPMGWLEGIATIPTNIVAGAIGMGATIASLFGNKAAKDPNNEWYTLQRYVTTTRDERGNVWGDAMADAFAGQDENKQEMWKGVGKFMNGVAYSMADNLLAMATTAGMGKVFNYDMASKTAERMIQLVMSSEATSATMLEQLKNGREPGEAAIMAIGGGLIEAITEKYSIENLLQPNIREMLGNGKQLLKFLGKNTLAEGAEEGASDVLNLLLDGIVSGIAGHETEIVRQIKELREANPNMPEEEAEKQVLGQWWQQLGMDIAAGALSGLVMSGGRVALNSVSQGRTGKNARAGKIYKANGGDMALINSAMELPEGSQSRQLAESIRKKIDSGRRVTNKDVGQLVQNIYNETDEQIGKAAATVVEDKAYSMLEGKDLGGMDRREAAQLISKAVSGEELSRKEKRTLSKNEALYSTYKEFVTPTETAIETLGGMAEATSKQQQIRDSVSELVGTKKAAEVNTEEAKTTQQASEQEIAEADQAAAEGRGKKTGTSRDVIVNGEYGQITGIIRDKDSGKNYFTVDVNGNTQQIDVNNSSTIRATDFGTAAIIRQAAIVNKGLYQASANQKDNNFRQYTDILLDAQANGKAGNIGTFLANAERVRIAAFTGQAMPVVNMDRETALAIYKNSALEHKANRLSDEQTGEANFKGAGNGSAVFNGAAYGTDAWNQALDDAKVDEITRNRMNTTAEIARRSGIEVTFLTNEQARERWNLADGEDAELYYGSEGKSGIAINIEGQNADLFTGEKTGQHHMMVTFGHEMTHWLQRNSMQGYTNLERFVASELVRTKGENHLNKRLGQIMEAQGLNLEDAMSELVAESCDQILASEEVQKHIAETNQSLFTEIKGFVKDLVTRIKNAVKGMSESQSYDSRVMMRSANELAKIWLGAYDEAISGAIREAEGNGTESGTKFSQATKYFDYDKTLRQQLIEYANLPEKEKGSKNKYILIGTTSKILEKIGLAKLPIIMNYEHVGNMLEGRHKNPKYRDDHIFDIEVLSHLPELLEEPVAVIFDTKPGAVRVLVNMRSISGRNAIVPISINKRKTINGERLDVNVAESTYGNESIINEYIAAIQKDSETDQRLYYVDKEKTQKVISIAQANLPGDLIIPDGYIRSISESDLEVNDKKFNREKPIKTQTDSIQFKRWFGNSKVVNKDGTPKIMYHGTRNQFTVFDKSKAKSSGTWGSGFYFTDQSSHAGIYGNQMGVYLRAERPLMSDNHRISKRMMVKFLEAVAENEDYGLENYGYGATPQSVADLIYSGKGDLDLIADVNMTAIGNMEEAINLFNEINGTKYDSVITSKETVVYSPYQIKSATDNIGTFDKNSPDIRYSRATVDQKQQELNQAWQDARDEANELREQLRNMKPEMDVWVERISAAQKDGNMDAVMAKYKEWEKGYTKVKNDLDKAEQRYKEANKAYDDYIEQRDVAEEQKKIEASGLSEPEYRRKQAVDVFGYTTDFREAGYLLPNGRMLNFTGEKGKHYGSRGEDHRGIGQIYASSEYQGGAAMMAFMRDGNIRVMAETPGVDIVASQEPTAEQYAAIRNMARRFAGEEYFNVDFTDDRGYNVDSIEYDGRVNPERVVNDIKTFYRTGSAPKQSTVSQFHYSRATSLGLDVGRWMSEQTPGSLLTESERELLSKYKGLRVSIDLSLKKQEDYKRDIRRMQANESQLTAHEREDLETLRFKLKNEEQKYTDLQYKLYQVTSADGYAGMMYQSNMILNDFVLGKTQKQVSESVDNMVKEMQKARTEIEKQSADLKKLAETQAVQTMKSYLKSTSLSFAAKSLKKELNSRMNAAEVENRLAEMALKKANGESIVADARALAYDMTNQMRGYQLDVMERMRGITITIGPDEQAEMKGNGMTLASVREALKGTGIRVKFGTFSSLDTDTQEGGDLRTLLPELPQEISENSADALNKFISWAQSQRDADLEAKRSMVDLEDATINVIALASTVTTEMTNDPAAKKQIDKLMKQVKDLNGRTEAIAGKMDSIIDQMDNVEMAGLQAKGSASVLQRDVHTAIDYFNKIAMIAAQEERMRVKKDVIEKLRSENTRNLIKQQMKYEEMMKNDRKARELAEDNKVLRNRITTVAKRAANRLFSETDQKNIPEEAKPLARKMLELLTNHDYVGYRHVLFYDKEQLERAVHSLDSYRSRDGEFNPDKDLNWLIVGSGEDADTEMADRAYDALMNIESGLLAYRQAEGQKNISLMDRKAALQKVQTAVSEIWSMIDARANAEINHRRMLTEEIALQAQDDMQNSRFKGENTGVIGHGKKAVKAAVFYGNMTPEYFFKMLRNNTISQLYEEYHRAENKYGLLADKTTRKIAEIADRYGFGTWDQKKTYTFQLEKGGEVELTLGEIMSLCATWQREAMNKAELNGPEKSFHLEIGGFVTEAKEKHKINGREFFNQRPHRVTQNDINAMLGQMTDDQKNYMYDLVAYITKEIGELGNEASMRMYGIKKFKEKFYFPMKVWNGVLARKSDAGTQQKTDNRTAHNSASKRRTANANNALLIRDFTQVVCEHTEMQLRYNTFAPAIEFMNRTMNQQLQVETGDPEGYTKRTLEAAFREAYGEEAGKYYRRFLEDINGGVNRSDANIYDKLLSTFKKSAVAGSMSVAFQQPLSYIRAAMMIDPKYLATSVSFNPAAIKKTAEEMWKYSGVAVIKKIGKFDMNYGRSTIDYMTPEAKKGKFKAGYEWLSDKTTALPELMDTWTWCNMWNSVKKEQAALNPGMDTKSNEFLEKVAERFNDVMRKTQVYDSVLVKSQNMRSTHWAMKGITSFMGEPTLTLNVLADAFGEMKAGDKGGKAKFAKAATTFILSAVMQALVKGLNSAGRNPQEKKTWDENVAYRFTSSLISEINPVSLIPGYSDLMTLFKDGEVSDDALSVIGNMIEAIKTGKNWITGDSENPWYRDLEDSIGVITQLFSNIPLKNLVRDVRAISNYIVAPWADRENSMAVLKYQALDLLHNANNMTGAINAWAGDNGWQTKNTAYYQRIYNADKAGNKTKVAELMEYLEKARGTKEKDINDELRSLTKKDKTLTNEEKIAKLREQGMKDSDIAQWITDQYSKKKLTKEEATKLYQLANPKANENDAYFAMERKDEGVTGTSSDYFRLDEAIEKNDSAAIRTAESELLKHGYKKEQIEEHKNNLWWKKDREDYKKATGKEVSGTHYRLADAIKANKSDQIQKAVRQMIDHGSSENGIQSWISQEYKAKYLKATGDEKRRLKDALTKALKATGMTEEKAIKRIDGWKEAKKK